MPRIAEIVEDEGQVGTVGDQRKVEIVKDKGKVGIVRVERNADAGRIVTLFSAVPVCTRRS